MAIVKATYTKNRAGAKASIRYIEHRPGRDGEKITRNLFNSDGLVGRWQANRMIDEAKQGSYFYRFAISPDMKTEDTKQDVSLREVTEQTMLTLEQQLQQQIAWVAAVHADHAPHRHMHVVAIVPERLQVQDFQAMRTTATEQALAQRHQRDLVLQQQQEQQKEAQWE
ncbi:MAG TPA: hypothetical protein VE843_17535 [Ktedonobacteraceae bacterium]|nr:hypothetical protein [Ktedonobacteraceae bacterium]